MIATWYEDLLMPESLPVLNALTIDVEDYYHVSNFAKVIPYKKWDSFESRVERNVERILQFLDRHGVRATFFVLGWVGERYPKVVLRIAEAGHEIACHTYSHQLVYQMSPEEFRRDTARAKAILEDLIQVPVRGFRAASYSIVEDSLWALDILVELGFTYDSSIFPVYHDRYGIPRWSRFPEKTLTPGGNRILEFPLSTLPVLGHNLPIAGGAYLRIFPSQLIEYGIHRLNNREHRPAILYFHPWEIDEEQPHIPAGFLTTFRHYHNISKLLPRLERLLRRFSFGPVQEVLKRHVFTSPGHGEKPPTHLAPSK